MELNWIIVLIIILAVFSIPLAMDIWIMISDKWYDFKYRSKD